MTTCPLDACRVCTGCAHGRHSDCRSTVTCPDSGETRPCRCCQPTEDGPCPRPDDDGCTDETPCSTCSKKETA